MAEPKYKLRLAFQWRESAKREVSAVREFVWEKKEDALACKALMEKATVPAGRVKHSEWYRERCHGNPPIHQ